MKLRMSPAASELLRRERAVITDLHALLGRLDAEAQDLLELKTTLADLEGIFLLVVCGEYNAGKSSLLNALLGERVMLEGVTPTTDRITVVSYGEEARTIEESASLLRREYPAPILRDLALVDTPGTNAVIQRHQELSERFVPRADLVLFVTSADRPFTETERRFLELIASWGKKIIVVINKMDLLEDGAERQKVLEFVRDGVAAILGMTLQPFGVEARRAFRARISGESIAGTGLESLEAHIVENLAAEARLQLKLQNPLGVAARIAHSYEEVVGERLALLDDDRRTLDEVDRQLEQFERDMRREFESYLSRIKTVLLEVERRGEVFFDDTVRLRHVFRLLDNERVREDFERRVVRSADRDIDAVVSEAVDWFLHRNLGLWEDVMTFVQARRKAGEERMIGEIGSRFQFDRDALIRSLSKSAEKVLEGFDEDAEARKLADSFQSAVFQTGVLQVSGVGLGAALVAFLHGLALDVTGIVAGLALVGLGLLVLPNRRQRAKTELHNQMQALRDGLATSLGAQFEAELRRALDRLHTAITPYTRFVRSELGRLETLQSDLQEISATLVQLKRDVNALASDSPPLTLEQRGV